MGRRVGMIHGISSNVRLFNDLTSEIMPDIDLVHFVDEGLLSLSGERSRERVVRRLKLLASFAEESEAEVVMLTCTAFGRLVDEVKDAINIPVLAVLEIIGDEAMGAGDPIGILATHSGTLESTSQMIQEQSSLRGKKVEVKALLCKGAFDALSHEDWATHDRIVLEHLNSLMEDVKAVVIPQPSIERIVKQISRDEYKVPILSSARLSAEHLKAKLDGLAM